MTSVLRRRCIYAVGRMIVGLAFIVSILLLALGDPQSSYLTSLFQYHVYPGYRWRSRKSAPTGFTGRWYTWHPNGRLHTAQDYENGRRHGVFKSWWPNGTRATECEFDHGVALASVTHWDRHGNRILLRSGKTNEKRRPDSTHENEPGSEELIGRILKKAGARGVTEDQSVEYMRPGKAFTECPTVPKDSRPVAPEPPKRPEASWAPDAEPKDVGEEQMTEPPGDAD